MSATITDRMRGAAMLDVPTYEAIEADRSATGQALTVVIIVIKINRFHSTGVKIKLPKTGKFYRISLSDKEFFWRQPQQPELFCDFFLNLQLSK